ncbi:MAG: chemotaxis protein CheW [Nitrospirae bacterium]|nr:MAG: chemotaxis protein CheW [Nitrospirota bacterium]
MLRGQSKETAKRVTNWSLMVFSIGGQRLAARIEEAGGVRPWTDPMPVPSHTPFMNALLRHDEEVLPVYDLAARLKQQVRGTPPLCLIVKREDGPMAVCIDASIPTLKTIDPQALQPSAEPDPDILGYCEIEGERVPLYSLAKLGMPTTTHAV